MQEPGESHTNSSVRAIPYYISETKSDMRGIKAGWYAIEADGTTLHSGPFSSFEECVNRIAQPTSGTLAS
jgi:hypothetical protein